MANCTHSCAHLHGGSRTCSTRWTSEDPAGGDWDGRDYTMIPYSLMWWYSVLRLIPR